MEKIMYEKGFRPKENTMLFDMAKFKQPADEVIALFEASKKFTETIRILTNEYKK